MTASVVDIAAYKRRAGSAEPAPLAWGQPVLWAVYCVPYWFFVPVMPPVAYGAIGSV
jgi:hypothetical protein